MKTGGRKVERKLPLMDRSHVHMNYKYICTIPARELERTIPKVPAVEQQIHVPVHAIHVEDVVHFSKRVRKWSVSILPLRQFCESIFLSCWGCPSLSCVAEIFLSRSAWESIFRCHWDWECVNIWWGCGCVYIFLSCWSWKCVHIYMFFYAFEAVANCWCCLFHSSFFSFLLSLNVVCFT